MRQEAFASGAHDGETRNFEANEGRFYVGGKHFPAQVRESEPFTNGRVIRHVTVPMESGWGIHGHLLYDANGQPRGRSGHVMGQMSVIHTPTLNHVVDSAVAGRSEGGMGFAFHEFPEGTPNTETNTSGKRVLKTVHSPDEFHDLVRYVSQLHGGREPRIPGN